MGSATKKRKSVDLPISQIIAVVVLTISVFVIVDFGRRAAMGYRISQEEKRLQAELATLETTHAALLEKRDYILSDQYVEYVARNELKWSRPNEQVVVILPENQPDTRRGSAVAEAKQNIQAYQTPWEAWKALFFPDDSLPPAQLGP